MNRIEKAIEYAKEKHKGQDRTSGKEYISDDNNTVNIVEE